MTVVDSAALYDLQQATKLAKWWQITLGQYFTALQAENGKWYFTNRFDPEVRK